MSAGRAKTPATDDGVERLRRELRDAVDLIRRSGGGVVFENAPGTLREDPPPDGPVDAVDASRVRVASAAALRDAAGQLRGFSEFSHDLSESQESEAKYRGLLEAAPDAMVVVNQRGEIVLLNVQAEKQFGYHRDELVGQQVKNIIPEGFAERLIADALRSAEDALAQQIGTGIELSGRRKDGSEFPLEIMLSPLESAEGLLVTAAIRDITARKKAEAHLLQKVDELNRSNERFRATFEQAAVGISHSAMDGRWLRVNQRCCDILGYTREELLERTFLDISHPDELALDHESIRRFLAGEIRTLSREKRFVHKNGLDVWVDVTISMARDPVERSDYLIAVLQDITARKQLEQELLHAQRMEGVGQLAGGIAHDFNNLLTVISGQSQLALERLASADPLRRRLDLIQKTSARAAALTRQLLAFSRKQVLQPKVLDLNELVAQSTSLLERLIGEHIELTFVPGADAGRVRVDPGQLEQVIVNLAVNARDAMPEGGRLTVETANVALSADYAALRVDVAPGSYVMLAVSDTGVGMDRAVQARIFEPFFTTKGPGSGTGLGLATVYGIVKQSGGHIRVYSEPGRGTAFKIYLPRTDAPTEPASAAAPCALPRGTETVLLVEDEDEVRRLVREVLEGLGYTVLEAAVPGDASLLAERHVGLIELLLTDVVMPGMSGRALASRVTAERPETKVLFISGYTDDAIVRHGVLAPGTSFLEKPFTPQALALKVREALNRPQ